MSTPPMVILVVEDDRMLADTLSEALAEDGHAVCGVASTVTEAVALVRRHRPDVAIIDLHLRGSEPGSDIGDRLMEAGDLGHMGILYVTGDAGRAFQEIQVGHACLGKPYRYSALGTALTIVRDIAREGRTSHALPWGLRLLRPSRIQPQSAL